jgi:hypothetical protein
MGHTRAVPNGCVAPLRRLRRLSPGRGPTPADIRTTYDPPTTGLGHPHRQRPNLLPRLRLSRPIGASGMQVARATCLRRCGLRDGSAQPTYRYRKSTMRNGANLFSRGDPLNLRPGSRSFSPTGWRRPHLYSLPPPLLRRQRCSRSSSLELSTKWPTRCSPMARSRRKCPMVQCVSPQSMSCAATSIRKAVDKNTQNDPLVIASAGMSNRGLPKRYVFFPMPY